MSSRRPIHRKALDALALALVGLYTASMSALPFRLDSWGLRAVAIVWALFAVIWFASLVLDVRFLWTGRESRLRGLLRRRARPASPSPG